MVYVPPIPYAPSRFLVISSLEPWFHVFEPFCLENLYLVHQVISWVIHVLGLSCFKPQDTYYGLSRSLRLLFPGSVLLYVFRTPFDPSK